MRAPQPVPGEGIADLIDDVLSGEGISYEAMHGALNDLAWAIGGSLNARPDMLDNDHERRRPRFVPPPGFPFPPRWDPQSAPPPPPPVVDYKLEERQKARRLMGFADGLPLTVEMVKDRKRELALQNHPDRGGDPRRMAAINHAADVLLEAL